MVLFPGENHELSRGGMPVHREKRLKAIVEWFDTHLKKIDGERHIGYKVRHKRG